MLTVAYNDVLFRAAELAGRTRDKIPLSEATMMQGFFAVDLQAVWNAHEWPELRPDPYAFSPLNRQISKQEDQTAIVLTGTVGTDGDGVFTFTPAAGAEHGLRTGDTAVISGITLAGLTVGNGTYTVNVISATQFTYVSSATNAAMAQAGITATCTHFQIGDVLAVWSANPLTTTRYRAVEWDEGDNAIRIYEGLAQVWVEYMLPRPDLMSVAAGSLPTYKLPARFSNYLALRAGGLLLNSDSQNAAGTVFLGLAESALAAEIRRTPIPDRRMHANPRNPGRATRTQC
jgi:hypothetical protein